MHLKRQALIRRSAAAGRISNRAIHLGIVYKYVFNPFGITVGLKCHMTNYNIIVVKENNYGTFFSISCYYPSEKTF